MPIRWFTKIAFKRLYDSGWGENICNCQDKTYKINLRCLPPILFQNSKHNYMPKIKEKSYYGFLVEYLKEIILIAEEIYKSGHGKVCLTSNSIQMDKEAKESFKKG